MMTNNMWSDDGGPAFPLIEDCSGGGAITYKGMSLRDWFAGQALINPRDDRSADREIAAKEAYEIADAMLRARSR